MQTNSDGGSLRSSAQWRDAYVLFSLMVVFLVSRVLWIELDPDSVTYWEENHRWASAMEILGGPIQPILDYQADTYQGGSLVMIGLMVGSFAMFGESVLAFKMPALLFAGATLVMLFTLARASFGRTAALSAGLLYVMGPPLLTYSSLLVMGSHGESALFSVIQVFILLGLLDGRFRTLMAWGVFGFVSGLGIWFCYTSGISLLACALTYFLLARTPRGGEIAAACAGGLLGLLPWLVFNVQNDFVGVVRLLEIFGGGNPIDAWEGMGAGRKALLFFVRDFPTGLSVPFAEAVSRPWSTLLSAGIYLPVLLALGLSLRRTITELRLRGLHVERAELGEPERSARAELVFWIYAMLILAVFLGSSFVIQPERGAHTYRLFLPAFTLMIVPMACSFGLGLQQGGAKRFLAVLLMLSFGLASVAGTAAMAIRPMERNEGHDAGGHRLQGYRVRGVLIHRKYEDELHRAFSEARRVPDLRYRFRVFQGIGWGIEYRFEGTGEIQTVLLQLDQLAVGERVAVLSGIRLFARLRVDELRERVASGEASDRDLAQLEHLETLRGSLQASWNRLPLRMRLNDRVIY